jgi:hypothetical protein
MYVSYSERFPDRAIFLYSAIHLELCHWLHTNRQLLPLTLFIDVAILPVMESTTHITRIDGLTTIHIVV